MKFILGILLVGLLILSGCSDKDGSLHNMPPCNANNVGEQIPIDCNTCTCTYDKDSGYGWTCTEIGCNAIPFI